MTRPRPRAAPEGPGGGAPRGGEPAPVEVRASEVRASESATGKPRAGKASAPEPRTPEPRTPEPRTPGPPAPEPPAGDVRATEPPAGDVRAAVLDDPAALAPDLAAWDELAVGASRPYCAPGWMLAWWSAARPAAAQFRAVTVHSGRQLAGLAAFHVGHDRCGITTWRLLADDAASYTGPLAGPGAREPVAAAITAALATADRPVDVLSLAAVPRGDPWPALLRDRWPGRRPHLALVRTMPAPYVDVVDGYDAWLAGRSANFRQQVRRRRRDLDRRGAQFRRAAIPAEVTTGLTWFELLHRNRWADRGGSQAMTPGISAMLRLAGGSLDPTRFQVWTVESDGAVIAVSIFLRAGTELHYWLGGFDEEWSRWSPSLLLLDEVVRWAAAAGFRRVSLGPGAAPYKARLATGEELLDWIDLLPHGLRYPYVRLCQAPYRLHRLASTRTPAGVKQRLRGSREGT